MLGLGQYPKNANRFPLYLLLFVKRITVLESIPGKSHEMRFDLQGDANDNEKFSEKHIFHATCTIFVHPCKYLPIQ